MARWLRQILVALLAVALAAGGGVPPPMAQAHPAQDHAAAAATNHHLAMAAMDDDAMAAVNSAAVGDTSPCHGMEMPCDPEQQAAGQPPAPHEAPACPNMMLCCVGAAPAVPATTLGIGAPITAGAVLALVLERAGDGHIPSPLPKIPRA